MPTPLEAEAIARYREFVAARDEVDAGKRSWASLGDFFTEDAVYIDPAWGRIEGREAIRDFMEKSMAGLTGYGWSTPENWIMAEGPRVVSQWDQVLGNDAEGRPWVVPGLSILYYAGKHAGQGLFCYSHDMLNMTHIGQTMRDMGWRPPKEFNMPPRKPVRDVSLPKAWAHLDPSRKLFVR
ncbi:MAG: nuclear transport factor 2 family protein [Myxococcota bacterium]